MIAFFRRRVVTHSYGGADLRIQLADPLARAWYDCNWERLPEIDLLTRGKLRAGATVFDLGAHQGVIALMLAAIVRPTGCVVAVEADPHNAKIGKKNCDLNREKNIRFITAAVAARPGVVSFRHELNGRVVNSASRGEGEWTRAVTIDLLTEQFGQPDVLFIDVEGAECKALEGATRTMQACPDCFVEVHAGCGLEALNGSVGQLIRCFPASDYDLFAKSEGDAEFVPLSRIGPTRTSRFYLVALSRYSSAHPLGDPQRHPS